MNALPGDLRGPVVVALAKAQDDLSASGSLPGGAVCELKWDGFRGVIVRDRVGARIWSRQGRNLSDAFQMWSRPPRSRSSPGPWWTASWCLESVGLDFDLLQRRLVNPSHRAASAEHPPASYMIFDVLAHNGQDLRQRPLRQRRAVLEAIGAQWRPPLQMSPSTTNEDVAREWFTDYQAAGVEGLVVKAADRPHPEGRANGSRSRAARRARSSLAPSPDR